MAIYKKWAGLAGALLASAVAAQPLDTSQTSLIQLAASMNEMALSCGHMSAAQLQKAQAKQREAMLRQGVQPAQYEVAYAGAKTDFATRWASISQDEQARNCAQVKAMSERGVGQLPNAK
ncbi:hypothetical protein [Comamonas jiangduensis]|jgi:hypothetical protein|uniref:Uncharacterized protein n=1 Tax=Comamonas jiangduensis TaxID=1194168 RepID=A0ABV4IAU5_9BURK